MNNFEQKSNAPSETTPEKKLEIFRSEIKRIKEIEMNKKQDWEERGRTGKAYDPHFDDIDPEYLGQAERDVYQKYESDNLTIEEFGALIKAAALDKKSLSNGEKSPLGAFLGLYRQFGTGKRRSAPG